MNRRNFFKRLGVISTALVVCPDIGLERLQYLNFVPGRTMQQAVRGPINPRFLKGQETAVMWGKRLLERWIEYAVPKRFRHGKRIYNTKTFDFGNKIGLCLNYKAPTIPKGAK